MTDKELERFNELVDERREYDSPVNPIDACIPDGEAALCLSCRVIFQVARRYCPRCEGESFLPLQRALKEAK